MKKSFFLVYIFTILTSCSLLKTSMSPMEVYNKLPNLTKTKFLKEDSLNKMNCKRLTENRSYNAPIGLTVNDDLKNGAKGIDEWVSIDKGNAYLIKNFQWVTVGYDPNNGTTATQLFIEFDTYDCNDFNK